MKQKDNPAILDMFPDIKEKVEPKDGRRQRRGDGKGQKDAIQLIVHEGKKYLVVPRSRFDRDESRDTDRYFYFRKKTKKEILEGL